MRRLGEIIRARLKEIDLDQKRFAKAVRISGSYLSKIIDGQRRAPVTRAAAWAKELRLEDAEVQELLDAMHLSRASDDVRDLVERLDAEAAVMRGIIAFYDQRFEYLRQQVDSIKEVRGRLPNVSRRHDPPDPSA